MSDELFKKKEYESENEYIARMYRDKIQYNLTNKEVAEVINLELGYDKAESTYRSIAYPFLEAYSLAYERGLSEGKGESNGNSLIEELEGKKRSIELERRKLQSVKVEYNKMLREQSRDELIIENIRDIIPTIEVPKFEQLQLPQYETEWLLSFGDIHYDKFFESINNKYSVEEIHRRFGLLLNKLIVEIKEKKISKLTITNLGDSLEGLLRISALTTMRIGLLESVVQFSRFMAEWLNELSKYVEIVYYHVPTANHSEIRLFNQKRGETDENLERIIVNYIHDLLRDNERVTIPIITDKNYIPFNLNGYNFIALHGDSIKNIKNSLKDLSMLHKTFYDYVLMGHFHSGSEMAVFEGCDNNMEVLVCPSIVGSDSYSDSLFVGSKSSAKLYGFTKGEGHTDTKTFILN